MRYIAILRYISSIPEAQMPKQDTSANVENGRQQYAQQIIEVRLPIWIHSIHIYRVNTP